MNAIQRISIELCREKGPDTNAAVGGESTAESDASGPLSTIDLSWGKKGPDVLSNVWGGVKITGSFRTPGR